MVVNINPKDNMNVSKPIETNKPSFKEFFLAVLSFVKNAMNPGYSGRIQVAVIGANKPKRKELHKLIIKLILTTHFYYFF